MKPTPIPSGSTVELAGGLTVERSEDGAYGRIWIKLGPMSFGRARIDPLDTPGPDQGIVPSAVATWRSWPNLRKWITRYERERAKDGA